MTSVRKPKRALLAYCALASRLQRPGAGLMEALIPFFAPVCREHAGKMFDAAVFSDEVFALYGLRVPRLAVLGLAEQLQREGLLEAVSGYAVRTAYRYAAVSVSDGDETVAVTEDEIDKVLADFVKICRGDDLLNGLEDDALHASFLDRLLNTESMRLLSRKETSGGRRASTTLTRKPLVVGEIEHREFRLDFHVAQFLIDLKVGKPDLFNRVSDIAFANMAAEALACFSEPPSEVASLADFVVYLDSPLLLDILGVNFEYQDYGKELLAMIQTAKAKPKVFDDAIQEAESVVSARLSVARSGVQSQSPYKIVSPHVLSALTSQVGAHAAERGIESKADPQLDLTRRSRDAYGTIQVYMDNLMTGWPNTEARLHDQRSVWAMLRIRDVTTPKTKIRDGRAIFVARNSALVRIANEAWRIWLRDAANHSRDIAERWAPIAMSDKQLAGYLWLRNSGANNGTLSRARLLAHCSAAIRPRQDVKNRAISLVLDLHGQDEADIVSALMEDRDGARALMRATKGDPEDVTPDRIGLIIDQVKLGAGEYAAERVREEERIAAQRRQEEHDAEIAHLKETAAHDAAKAGEQSQSLAQQLAQEALQRVQSDARAEQAKAELDRERRGREQIAHDEITKAFARAERIYRRSRWEVYFLYFVMYVYASVRLEGTTQIVAIIGLTMAGFWFLPSFLDKLLSTHAGWFFKRKIANHDAVQILSGVGNPNFGNSSWATDYLAAKTQVAKVIELSHLSASDRVLLPALPIEAKK